MIARGTSSLPRPSGFQQGIHDFVSLYHQTHQMSKRGEGAPYKDEQKFKPRTICMYKRD